MKRETIALLFCGLTLISIVATNAGAQGIQPYPDAITDWGIHTETWMAPPPVNTVFTDPDFGSAMVRATDRTTNFKNPGSWLRTAASGEANMWSVDTSKFYVIGEGGVDLAFAFDPSTMAISSLPGAEPGQALHVPLRPEASFSFVDPDLIYGTTSSAPLTINSYRFSSGVLTPVFDTTTCGTQPPLVKDGHLVVSDDDVTLSADDSRISISEGGKNSGSDMFVIVYDKNLGCRWYNTQTGEIGGQWGPSGFATTADTYLIRHAYISRSGSYVQILNDDHFGAFIWDVASLNVTDCPLDGDLFCGGYGVVGYNSYVNGAGYIDDMNILKRPLSNLAQFTQLVSPLPSPPHFGDTKHFTWSNVDAKDSLPVCGSTYSYAEDWQEYGITRPFEEEIFCVETDGIASTIWRFAHNRATWQTPYFNTQPLGNISMDGHFFLFTSGWDGQLGSEPNGTPLSDVWIVKLD
ncbi:MAG: hypothetical protein WBF04_25025 [Candidatus Sulfotelmatobacter sp.]